MTEAAQDNQDNQAPEDKSVDASSLLSDSESKPLDFSEGRPEEFPEDFWDAERNAPDVNKLFLDRQQAHKRADGLRAKLSKGEYIGNAPEDVAEYKIDIPDEIKEHIPDDDPLVAKAREVAKSIDMPVDKFAGFMKPLVEEVIKMRDEANKEPTEEELKAERDEILEKLGPNGHGVLQALNTSIEGLVNQGRLTGDDAVVMKNWVMDGNDLRVLNRLRMMIDGANQVPVKVPDAGANATKEELGRQLAEAMMKKDELQYNKIAAQLAELT